LRERKEERDRKRGIGGGKRGKKLRRIKSKKGGVREII
jgi:hypothetical protein